MLKTNTPARIEGNPLEHLGGEADGLRPAGFPGRSRPGRPPPGCPKGTLIRAAMPTMIKRAHDGVAETAALFEGRRRQRREGLASSAVACPCAAKHVDHREQRHQGRRASSTVVSAAEQEIQQASAGGGASVPDRRAESHRRRTRVASTPRLRTTMSSITGLPSDPRDARCRIHAPRILTSSVIAISTRAAYINAAISFGVPGLGKRVGQQGRQRVGRREERPADHVRVAHQHGQGHRLAQGAAEGQQHGAEDAGLRPWAGSPPRMASQRVAPRP